MSTLKCEVCKIENILPHGNADRLEIALVKGWQCITLKEKYKTGDEIVYIPIDSMIPFQLSEKIGVTNYLHNQKKDEKGNIISGRVKTIKLRGIISQGLIIDKLDNSWKIGEDVREILGITKYIIQTKEERKRRWILGHKKYESWRLPPLPNFPKYTDIENFKNHTNIIENDELVVISEKLHGTNFRAALLSIDQIKEYLPRIERFKLTIRKHLHRIFKFIQYEENRLFVGSRNCNLKDKKRNDLCNDSYWNIAKRYNLKDKLKPGEVIYGEIIGKKIQFLDYGLEEVQVRFFDLFREGKYVNFEEFKKIYIERNLPSVPILFIGKFSSETLKNLSKGNSTIAEHIREGCVVKPLEERYDGRLGRVILKFINDEYLLEKTEKDLEDLVEH